MEARLSSPKRRLNLLVVMLVALVAVVALAWIALAIAFPPARVRALVRDQLRASLARDVSFEDASLGLWPPVRLGVTRFRLAEPGGFERGAALDVERLALDLDPFALLARTVRVRRLVVDRPALHVLLREDGTTNLDSLGAPPKAGAPAPSMDFDVRSFVVHDGKVLVDDRRAARRITFGVGTSMSLATSRGGQRVTTSGRTELDGLAFGPATATRLADLNNSLAGLRWRVSHRGAFDAEMRRLAFEQLALGVGKSELALSGIVDRPGPAPLVNLRARGTNVSLADVLGWLAAADAKLVHGVRGRGRLDFDLAILGALGGANLPQITGTLGVADGAVRYPGATVEVENLSFHARFDPDRVAIPDMRARVAGQPVRARLGASRFADPIVDFAVQGDVDLGAIAPLVAPPDVSLGGRAALDVRGRGRAKDPGSLAVDGRAKLENVRVASKGLPKPVEGVNGAIAFSSGAASVTGLTARAGASSFTLDANVARPLALMSAPGAVAPARVDFDFRSPHLDLAELLPTTPGTPFLPNATGGGRVAIARLMQGKLDAKNVRADVTLQPAELASPAYSFEGYGGTVTGKARFDLRDTARPVYSITTDVKNVQADDLLSAWTPARGLLHGALSTNLEFAGAGTEPEQLKRTLTLVGLAALSEGKLGPGPTLAALSEFVKIPQLKEVRFKDLRLPMRIEQGRVVTDPVVLNGSSGEWRLTGAIGFDGALDYAVSVTLPPEAAAALGARSALAAGALSDDQGRVLLDLRVTGSAKSPRIAWDTRAMRDRLAGRVSQAFAEQRAKLEAETREAARAALEQAAAGARDSARTSVRSLGAGAADSLRRAAGGLLENFFGRKPATNPRPQPPATPPAPPPHDTTAAPDTTRG